jgi:hypothetical protein
MYKLINNTKYVNTFPDEWINNTYYGTGPKYCTNCKIYGSIDDIFIGYCGDCSQHIYNFERGDGFEVYASELILENNTTFCNYIEIEKYNIINYLENRNRDRNRNKDTIISSAILYWDCDYCQSVNFNNLNYCISCKQKISNNIDDNVVSNFNNMSIC